MVGEIWGRVILSPLLLAVIVGASMMGCGVTGVVDDDPDVPPNVIEMLLDGAPMPIDEEFSRVMLARDKKPLGTYSWLYANADVYDDPENRAASETIRLNVGAMVSLGVRAVRYSPQPVESDVWLSLTNGGGGSIWQFIGYSGDIDILEIGEPGGRLRASFDEIRATDTCGTEHAFSEGRIDVRIGSDRVYPATDSGEVPAIDNYDIYLHNVALVEVDGLKRVCEFNDYELETWNVGGVDRDYVFLGINCWCGLRESGNQPTTENSDMFLLAFWVPVGEPGPSSIIREELSIWDNINLTDMASDDPVYRSTRAVPVSWVSVNPGLEGPLEVKLTEPVTLYHVSGTPQEPGVTRKELTSVWAYGMISADCRPGICL